MLVKFSCKKKKNVLITPTTILVKDASSDFKDASYVTIFIITFDENFIIPKRIFPTIKLSTSNFYIIVSQHRLFKQV